MTANANTYASPLRINPARGKAAEEMLVVPDPKPLLSARGMKGKAIPGAGEYDQQLQQQRVSVARNSPVVSIEYASQHWFILVKASGRWAPLYHPTKKIQQQNQFGDVIASRPAIMTFADFGAALTHVQDQLPMMRLVKRSIWSRYFSNPVL